MEFNSADIQAFRDIWVFCEQREGKLSDTDFELISEGRKLADERGARLVGVVLGWNLGDEVRELGGYGADEVIVCDHPLLEVYTTDAYAKVLCDVVMEEKPEVLLIGASHIGRDLGPRCAARLHTGLTADCTHLDIDISGRVLHAGFGGGENGHGGQESENDAACLWRASDGHDYLPAVQALYVHGPAGGDEKSGVLGGDGGAL